MVLLAVENDENSEAAVLNSYEAEVGVLSIKLILSYSSLVLQVQ